MSTRYNIPCSPPSENCSEIVEKNIIYFAPTDKMLADGLSEIINTQHIPRLTTLVPGSIPPLSLVSPWELGKQVGIAYKRVDAVGYAAHLTKGDTLYMFASKEDQPPFNFQLSGKHFPKVGLPLFSYYFELFCQNATAVLIVLILKEVIWLVVARKKEVK